MGAPFSLLPLIAVNLSSKPQTRRPGCILRELYTLVAGGSVLYRARVQIARGLFAKIN
jgi:hypothetical protein